MAKKIIVIDDSETVRQQIREAVTRAGYQVVEAEDGVAGLDTIRTHGDAALVLCDISMPRMGGLDLLEALRKTPRHATLPVVMVTTEGHGELIAKAKQFGAKGWMVKPFQPDMLVTLVKKIAGPA
mgnify:FL=1